MKSKTVKITRAEADKSLTNTRRLKADKIFAEIYLNGEQVEDHEGWEHMDGFGEERQGSFNVWTRTCYMRNQNDPDGDTSQAQFSITFRANSAEPEYAMLDNKELLLP